MLPVITNPSKIICVGLNYHAHVEECEAEQTDYPVIFLRVADSQIGHQEDLILPNESTMFDFEGEIAVRDWERRKKIKKRKLTTI